MSSRALRKAQKERELLRLQQEDFDEEDVEFQQSDKKVPQKSAFAMLVEDSTAKNEHSDEDEPGHDNNDGQDNIAEPSVQHGENKKVATTKASTGTSKKKKKKKNKLKAPGAQVEVNSKPDGKNAGLDEIDKALQTLSVSEKSNDITFKLSEPTDAATLDVCQFLKIDVHHLQVGNEMRRLFGRAAVDADREAEQQESASRRRATPGDSVRLGEAVAGHNALAGSGLPAVLRRRNIFAQGKEDWPRATGTGPGMEIVERRPGGIVEYTFTHGPGYQSSQHEFQACVKSYDPSMLVNLLRFIPYHVATLLQVSEIAKQEKDYATAGELLERALFSFGRAVHSTFAANLAQGKARLDFRRPENREFWLAVWSYIGNISMRATWRTAYEWARLLLSLDPENDPYCVSLIIDQLALRSKQAQNFLDLSRSAFFAKRWATLANISYSQALAVRNVDKDKSRAEGELVKAMARYPWVGARLYKELDISKIPPNLWGQTPVSPVDILHCELYATKAIDLWKLPETTKFLVESASESGKVEGIRPFVNPREITKDEARHVLLTDNPDLIGHLPHSITSKIDSSSDPLPPDDSINSYDITVRDNNDPQIMANNAPGEFIRELDEQQRFFDSIFPGVFRPTAEEDPDGNGAGAAIDEDTVREALRRTGVSHAQLRERMRRLVTLRETLSAQPDRRVASDDGNEVVMLENGLARTRIQSDRYVTTDEEDSDLGVAEEEEGEGEAEVEEEQDEAVPPPIRGNR